MYRARRQLQQFQRRASVTSPAIWRLSPVKGGSGGWPWRTTLSSQCNEGGHPALAQPEAGRRGGVQEDRGTDRGGGAGGP